MKNLFFALSFVFLLASCAKEQDVIPADQAPVAVMQAFNDKYPGASEVEWYEESEEWDAAFMLNEMQMNATFAADGQFLSEEISDETEDGVCAKGHDKDKYHKGKKDKKGDKNKKKGKPQDKKGKPNKKGKPDKKGGKPHKKGHKKHK